MTDRTEAEKLARLDAWLKVAPAYPLPISQKSLGWLQLANRQPEACALWKEAPARFDKLRFRGLVERRSFGDGRATIAIITDKGRLLIERIALLAVMQQGATES